MQLTADQAAVLAHCDGWCQVVGGPGTGRTTALVERWRRQAARGRPDRLLVVCRSRDAADRFRRAALAGSAWAADTLAFTTPFGVAFDLLRRHDRAPRLLGRSQQWAIVRELLVAEDARLWPGCGDFVRRAAFVDHVAAAVLAVEAAGAADDEVRAVADRWGQGSRWADLLAFRHRYRRAIQGRGLLDQAQLFTEAASLLDDDRALTEAAGRWDEVLIDDADTVTAGMGRLVDRLSGMVVVAAGDSALAAGDSALAVPGGWARWPDPTSWQAVVRFDGRHRIPPAPTTEVCRHPSSEPEAVAAHVLAAHQAGVTWAEMAVLVPRLGPLSQSVGRALARHGIPARLAPAAPSAEPVVRALLDFLAWAGGDTVAFDRLLVSPALELTPGELRRLRRRSAEEGVALAEQPPLSALAALKDEVTPRLAAADPAALVYLVWVRLLGRLVPDPSAERPDALRERELAALRAYLAGVSDRARDDPSWRIADELALAEGPVVDPDPWLPGAPAEDEDAVTVATTRSAAGRSWDMVVVCGCLEGELPRLPTAVGFFDPAVLDATIQSAHADGPPAGPQRGPPPGLAQRREWALALQRRLFDMVASRARSRLVLTAAPAPGQAVSRFLHELASAPMTAAAGVGAPAAALRPRVAPRAETDGAAPVYPDRRLHLSASRLTTYDDCPLRYFYGYALGVRGPGGVAASMGTVVHEALAAFFDPTRRDALGGQRIAEAGGGGTAPNGLLVTAGAEDTDRSWPALEELARGLWDEGWSETIAPYQPMREQARRDVFDLLRSWWDAESAQAAAGTWPHVVAVEYPFEIDVGGHRVRGYIDRVDLVDGGLAIVDYKTGSKVPRPDEVADDLQLATYYLAARRDPALAALGPPVSLELCYLRKGVVVSQPITDDHEARTEARIVAIAERILAEEFEPSVEADCEYCEFKRLCPLQPEGRRVVGE